MVRKGSNMLKAAVRTEEEATAEGGKRRHAVCWGRFMTAKASGTRPPRRTDFFKEENLRGIREIGHGGHRRPCQEYHPTIFFRPITRRETARILAGSVRKMESVDWEGTGGVKEEEAGRRSTARRMWEEARGSGNAGSQPTASSAVVPSAEWNSAVPASPPSSREQHLALARPVARPVALPTRLPPAAMTPAAYDPREIRPPFGGGRRDQERGGKDIDRARAQAGDRRDGQPELALDRDATAQALDIHRSAEEARRAGQCVVRKRERGFGGGHALEVAEDSSCVTELDNDFSWQWW
ncbi:hypothetical protein DFH07DRAFT_940252 [Mycena maculata]|uniref:Uncharacterized protein n=1 Tax=Mycena maculata TaxID=230809 RepID=A0AAD7J8H2_9AGAR|nr:hypothetical protein DFH07DRAFT_940252 [Mycena maculata]